LPEITVVCPVYCHTDDHRTYLREALESVAEQRYGDIELVIVDDASPIDIVPIVEGVEQLPPTRVLRNAANLGHAESRNVGIRAAESEMIAFLDHDDLWLPDKLERQVEAMRTNPDAAMVFCDVEILRQAQDDGKGAQDDGKGAQDDGPRAEDDGPYAQGLYIDQRTVAERPSLIWFVTHSNCVITVSSVLVKKQAMLDIGLFDSRYSSCDDFDAWIKILARAPIVHLPETLARYRLHAHNVNYSVDRLADNRLLTGLMLDVWRGLGAADKLRLLPALARKLAGRGYWWLKGR
jgi:glycosyltransferase involved in cell wall biosynthesis